LQVQQVVGCFYAGWGIVFFSISAYFLVNFIDRQFSVQRCVV